jgi:pantothenate kinase-related protein Tda10
MAYDKKKIFEQAMEAIEKHKLFFIDDIVAFLPIAKSTFYEWKMEQSEELKASLEKNRTELKVSMRSKWYKSNAPALQMALMKLICNDDERKKLSMQYTESTIDVNERKPIFGDNPLDDK